MLKQLLSGTSESRAPCLNRGEKETAGAKKYLLFAGTEVPTGRRYAQGCRTAEPSPPWGASDTTSEAAALL